MIHRTTLLSASAVLGVVLFAAQSASAAPASVNYNGKTYYMVNGLDPKMDSGNEVCGSIGKKCVGYTHQGTNAVCKLFHPNAKTLVSVNGSKSGFFCNGAPQKGLACEKTMNTCEVCPACNVNADCTTAIGQQFREMYVECGGNVVSSRRSLGRRTSSSKRAGTYGVLPLPRSSSRAGGQDPRIGQYPGKVICEFYQVTKPGDYAKSNKKLVTCGAYKAADNFCVIAMQSQYAKAERCEDQGIIICSNPCNPPTYQLPLQRCAADNDRPRGINAPPYKFCSSSSAAASTAAKKKAGELCQHGGDCQSGWCLGVVPGREYRCSCIDPTNQWQGCRK